MATNDFLPVATAPGATVLSQEAWASLLATQGGNGFGNGILMPDQFNKALRQPGLIAAALAQLVCDQAGLDMLDAGSVPTLESNILAMLQTVAGAVATSSTNIVTAGGATVLSVAQAATRFIFVTGALTSNATIVFPASNGAWTVINSTTGAFTLQGVVTGGTGVPVKQGSVDTLVRSGTAMRYAQASTTTAAPGDSSTAQASTAFVSAAIAALGTIGALARYGVGSGLRVNGSNVDAVGIEYATANIATPYNGATYNTNTNAGPFAVTLPANPPTGWSIVVIDIGNSWGASNLTLTYTGKPIGDDRAPLPEDYLLNVSNYGARVYYDGTAYRVRQMRLSENLAALTPGNITGGGPLALEAISTGDVLVVRGAGSAQGAAWAMPPDQVSAGAALRPPFNPVADTGGAMYPAVSSLLNPGLTGFLELQYWDIKLLSNGNYVRCWGWVTGPAGFTNDVMFDIIDRVGNSVVAPTVAIAAGAANGGFAPLICALTGGGFIITGYSGTSTPASGQSYFRVYSNAGIVVTGNTAFSALLGAPSGLLALANGNFAMICDLQPAVGLISPHLGVFGPNGAVVTAPFILQPGALNTVQSYAGRFSTRMCLLSGGGFGVACFGNQDSSGPYAIAGERFLTFNAAGVQQGTTAIGRAQSTNAPYALAILPLLNGNWMSFSRLLGAAIECRVFSPAGAQVNATHLIGASSANIQYLGTPAQLAPSSLVVCPLTGGASATNAAFAYVTREGDSSGISAAVATVTAGAIPAAISYGTSNRFLMYPGGGAALKWLSLDFGGAIKTTQADTVLPLAGGAAGDFRLLPGSFPLGNIPSGKTVFNLGTLNYSSGGYSLGVCAVYDSRDAAYFIGGATANAAPGAATQGVWGGGMVPTRYIAQTPISINSMTAATDGTAGRWIGSTLYVYPERSARVPGLLLQLNGGGAVGTITLPYAMMVTIGVDSATATLNGVVIPAGETTRPFAAGQTITLVATGTTRIIVTGIEARA